MLYEIPSKNEKHHIMGKRIMFVHESYTMWGIVVGWSKTTLMLQCDVLCD